MASASKSNLLVFGATGVIGRYIVHELIADKEHFGRIAAFTSPGSLENKADAIGKLKKSGVEILTGDLTKEEDVLRAYEGFDTVISALGRNVIGAQIPLLDWAENKAPNIKRFYPSEYGTDIEYNPITSPHEKPHQQKLKVRAYIRNNIRRLNYTYLVTGPYADMYLWPVKGDTRIGSWDVKARKATLLGTGEEKISLTTMRDVGRLLVASLMHPAESRNRALIVNSFTATPNEILAEFESQTGEKWAVDYTSLEDLKKIEKEMWEAGLLQATGATLRRIWTEGGTLYKKRDNESIGAPESEVLEAAVRRQIKEQVEDRYLDPSFGV